MTHVIPWVSPSRMACYDECPAEYQRRYVWHEPIEPNAPMWFGTAVHKGLEAHYRGEDGELAFRRKWRELCAELQAANVHAPNAYFESGLALIEKTVALGLSGEPERKVWVRIEAYLTAPILGYVDLWSPDTHTIYDFKTTLGAWSAERAEREIWQPGLYSYAYWLETETLPAFEYIVLNRGTGELQRFRTQRSHDQISDMLAQARHIALAITREEFDCTCTRHVYPEAA